jgi:hypothetical protein
MGFSSWVYQRFAGRRVLLLIGQFRQTVLWGGIDRDTAPFLFGDFEGNEDHKQDRS